MKNKIFISFLMAMLQFLGPVGICQKVYAQDAKPAVKDKAAVAADDNGLMQRIDFGNSYIMGQTIQSGAVYLLQRKKSEIKSMLKARQNYREEILQGFKISSKEMANNGQNQR